MIELYGIIMTVQRVYIMYRNLKAIVNFDSINCGIGWLCRFILNRVLVKLDPLINWWMTKLIGGLLYTSWIDTIHNPACFCRLWTSTCQLWISYHEVEKEVHTSPWHYANNTISGVTELPIFYERRTEVGYKWEVKIELWVEGKVIQIKPPTHIGLYCLVMYCPS